MLGTILSIVGGFSDAVNIYKFGSTLAKGDDAERVLGALDRIHAQVERLNDHILYAPGIEGLYDTAGATQRLGNLRHVRELLEPVQGALGGEIVSSELIETPHKMERALIENPWAVLEDIRPQHLAVRPANPDKVPVMFAHLGVRYIGWQMRAALPILFNCELRDLPGLNASVTPEIRNESPPPPPADVARRPGGDAQAKDSAPQPRPWDQLPAPNWWPPSSYEDKSQRLIRSFKGYPGVTNSVAFSPDGRLALSGGLTGITLWEVETGHHIRSFEGHSGQVNSVAFSPDGRLALSGGDDAIPRLWEVETGCEIRSFQKHSLFAAISTVAFSPDGRLAVSGDSGAAALPLATIKLCEVETGRHIRNFKCWSDGYKTLSISFSLDGRLVLWGNSRGDLRQREVETGHRIRCSSVTWWEKFLHSSSISCLAFSPDGRLALWGWGNNTLTQREVETTREIWNFKGLPAPISSVAFSLDGRLALSGDSLGALKLWEVATGRQIRNFKGHRGTVHSVAFSPDRRLALSGGEGGIKLWDVSGN